jgi:hypothetical protein
MRKTLAFPKPKDKRVSQFEAFKVMPDGREICFTHGRVKQSLKGRVEYRRRVSLMHRRQGGRCCLEHYAPMCPGVLILAQATFEHENGRGGGKRDDRIELPDGRWINGAAHFLCNQWKSSRRLNYNRDLQHRVNP